VTAARPTSQWRDTAGSSTGWHGSAGSSTDWNASRWSSWQSGTGKASKKSSTRYTAEGDIMRGGWMTRVTKLADAILFGSASAAVSLAEHYATILAQESPATKGWRMKAKILMDLVCSGSIEAAQEMARTVHHAARKSPTA